jgi:hypothetical protein
MPVRIGSNGAGGALGHYIYIYFFFSVDFAVTIDVSNFLSRSKSKFGTNRHLSSHPENRSTDKLINPD